MKLGKLIRHWIFRILVGSMGCVLGTFLLKEYITAPILKTFIQAEQLRDGIQNILSGLILLLCYYIIYRWLEQRKLKEIALTGFAKDAIIGSFSGFGLISLCMLMLYLLGYYTIEGFEPVRSIVPPFTLLISAALLEEIVFRGIIYRILEERWGTEIALVQALFFGVLHYWNVNSTLTSVWFVVMLGIVLSLLFTWTRNVWLPFFFHLSWNFAQIVYDTPLSGDARFNSLVLGRFNGPSFFVGSQFGIEDSFFSILLITLMAGYLYLKCGKKGKLTGFVRKPSRHNDHS